MENKYSRDHQFTHPAPELARLHSWSSTDHERHLAKSSSHAFAGEPASSLGSKRTPSQGLRGGALANWVLILRFRKAARACKAAHRDPEQSPSPVPTPKLTRETPCASTTWKQGQRPPGSKTAQR